MSNLSIRYRKTAFKVHICISSLVPIAPPPPSQLSCLECGPGDNKSPWCLCVCQRERGGRQKERQRESRAGSRVKGGADPGGAQGSRWRSVSREGVVFWVAALVLIETSNVTKTDLTGRVNGAAVTEQPYPASNTLRPPLSPRLAPPYFSSFPPPPL